MTYSSNTFGKKERLSGSATIDRLYKEGESFLEHPVVVYFKRFPDLKNTQVLVSVSKKRYKRATERNLIKRRLREAYRINKYLVKYPHQIALVYVGAKIVTFSEIQSSVTKALNRLEQSTSH